MDSAGIRNKAGKTALDLAADSCREALLEAVQERAAEDTAVEVD